MISYLLDTNVLSEIIKKRPSEGVRARLDALEGEAFTSAICVMELRFGAARHRERDKLWQRIADQLLSRVTILPITAEVAVRAGEILAALEKRGRPIGTEDVLIGATALVHDLAVATRNDDHLGRIDGLDVENWWT